MQKRNRRFNPGEAIVPGIALAFGIAYFIQTRDASMVAVKWPYIIATLTGLLWLAVVLLFVFRAGEEEEKSPEKGRNIGKISLILIGSVVYVASMPYIGFGIGSFLFLAIVFRFLGSDSWLRNVAVSFSITAFLYISMIVLMKMSLPRLIIGSIQI